MATPSRMRARSQGGRNAEVDLMLLLEAEGWVCGSRRHIGGAGDILAVSVSQRTRLIEVKTTAGGPYERFGPADREALSRTAAAIGADAYLVWRVTPRDEWKWLSKAVWPSGGHRG